MEGRDASPIAADRSVPGFEDRWAGCLLLLLLLALILPLGVQRLGWVPYPLVRDLPWAGVALAGLALAEAVARRGGAAYRRRPGRRPPARRGWRITVLIAGGVVTLAVLAPGVVPRGERALSLAVSPISDEGLPAVSPRRVSRLTFGPASGGPWTSERFAVTISGWLYVPLTGSYHFVLDADGWARMEIDGSAIVADRDEPGPPGPSGPVESGTRVRRVAIDLDAGLHRIDLFYLHETGPARLALRWIPPYFSRTARIPADHLVPDGTSAWGRRLRTLALATRRAGILALVLLLGAGAGPLVARVVRRSSGPRVAAPALARRSAFLLLFLTLTETSALYSAAQVALVRQALLAVLVAGGAWLAVAASRGGAPGPSWRAPRSPAARTALALGLLLVVQIALTARFLAVVDGHLIFAGEHSSLLYRYHILSRTFPRLLNYDPWWNAGTLDEPVVLSGAASVFLLGWPLIRLLSLEAAYRWFIPLVTVFVVPWALFAATRLLGLSRLAALIAGLLALAPDEVYFFFIRFGTLPALLSAALATLVFALAWRVFTGRDRRWGLLLALLGAVNLGLFWPLFPAMVVPALLAGALALRRRLRPGDIGLAGALAGVLVLVNAGWLTALLRAPRAFTVASTVAPADVSSGVIWHGLTDAIPVDLNPIGLALGVAGVFLLARPLRLPYGVLVGWLVAVVTFGPVVFPFLELVRFVIPLAFALIPPAAGLAARQLRHLRRGLASGVSGLLGVGLLVVLTLHLGDVWGRFGNEGRRPYRQLEFMPAETRRLVDWLRAHASTDGRILFVNGGNHEYGAHVAYLQALAGRPMLAASYYFADWGDGPVIRAILDDLPNLRRNLELFNVRYVVVHAIDPEWWSRLSGVPWLRRRAELGRIAVYETDARPSYLVAGRGAVTFDYNRIVVRLDEPAAEVTLKFRWLDGLHSVPPLPMEGVAVGPLTQFIRVRPGPVREFEVRY